MKASVSFDDFLKEQLKDPEFAKEYKKAQQEMEVIEAMLHARESKNLTQKQLAKRCGMHQSDICKIENGTRNPTIKMLQKIANGMDMKLKIEFVPNC